MKEGEGQKVKGEVVRRGGCEKIKSFFKPSTIKLVLVIVVFILLTGIDEPVMNKTINSPDDSCSVDSDCVVKETAKSGCGSPQCVNQDWEYYDSMINSVFALSCVPRLLYSCSCVENKCESKDLRKSTDINDCEKLEGYEKENCIRVISYNINRTNENLKF